jgi:hypothetical protein
MQNESSFFSSRPGRTINFFILFKLDLAFRLCNCACLPLNFPSMGQMFPLFRARSIYYEPHTDPGIIGTGFPLLPVFILASAEQAAL